MIDNGRTTLDLREPRVAQPDPVTGAIPWETPDPHTVYLIRRGLLRHKDRALLAEIGAVLYAPGEAPPIPKTPEPA